MEQPRVEHPRVEHLRVEHPRVEHPRLDLDGFYKTKIRFVENPTKQSETQITTMIATILVTLKSDLEYQQTLLSVLSQNAKGGG